MNNTLLTLVFVAISILSFSQDEKVKDPEVYFADKNYSKAIKGFSEKLKQDPENYEINLKLGLCYLESYIDKSKALDYLEKIKDSPNNNFEVLYYLGRAYHLNYKPEKAIILYDSLLAKSSDATLLKNATIQQNYCKNAIKNLANPKNVKLKNLGKPINSNAPDYNAFIEENEELIVFTSKRKKSNKGKEYTDEGYYTSDVYVSYHQDGDWQKPRSQSKVCTKASEEVVGLSADAELMFLDIAGRNVNGEMVVSHRNSKSFKEPIRVEKSVNTNAIEKTASVSSDKNDFYYASDRKGGLGGMDIFMSHRLPDLSWAQPKELVQINSVFDELFPQLSPDEKTLYFSSKGFDSMGGFDLFKSKWDSINKKWGKPENMGYPINTPDDDLHFSINKSGSVGYISTFRKNSLGNLDIYEVNFLTVEKEKTVVVSNLFKGTGTLTPAMYNSPGTEIKGEQILEYTADILDENGDILGQYKSNSKNGKMILVLEPGKYEISIMPSCCEEFVSEINVLGKGSFVPMMDHEFILSAIKKE